MKLEVHERILLLNLLPKEGDYAALREIRRAREMLGFTPDEQKFYEFDNVKDPSGVQRTVWNPKKAAEAIKDVPVTEYITSVIRVRLRELDSAHKLSDEQMSLFEKFVVMYT